MMKTKLVEGGEGDGKKRKKTEEDEGPYNNERIDGSMLGEGVYHTSSINANRSRLQQEHPYHTDTIGVSAGSEGFYFGLTK